MAYCSNCGKEIADGVRYCPECGAVVTRQLNTEPPEKNHKKSGRPGPFPGIMALVLGFFSFGMQSRGTAVCMSLAALIIGIFSLVKRVKLRGFAIAAIVFAVINFMAGSGTSAISQPPRAQTSSETKSSGNGTGAVAKKAPAVETKAADKPNQGVDPDLKDFLDSYEAFVDEYVVFMQQYSKNPTDLSLLARYTDIMQKYSDFAVKVEKYDTKEMSTEDAAYYLEVTSRCSQKMLKVLDSESR